MKNNVSICPINIPKKCYKIKRQSITCSHIWHVDISKCVFIRRAFCESLVKICATKRIWHSFLWYYFQTQCSVSILQQKTVLEIINPVTLGTTRVIFPTFSKYFRPLHKLGYVGSSHKVFGKFWKQGLWA